MIRVLPPLVCTTLYLRKFTSRLAFDLLEVKHRKLMLQPKNTRRLGIIKEGRMKGIVNKKCQLKRLRLERLLLVIRTFHKYELYLPKGTIIEPHFFHFQFKAFFKVLTKLHIQTTNIYYDNHLPLTSSLLQSRTFPRLKWLKLQYNNERTDIYEVDDLVDILKIAFKLEKSLLHFSLCIFPMMNTEQIVYIHHHFSKLQITQKLLEIFTPEVDPGFSKYVQRAVELQVRQISDAEYDNWRRLVIDSLWLPKSVINFDLWKPTFEKVQGEKLKIYLVGEGSHKLSILFSSPRNILQEFHLILPAKSITFAPLPAQVRKCVFHVIISNLNSISQLNIIQEFKQHNPLLESNEIYLHSYHGEKDRLSIFKQFILEHKINSTHQIWFEEGRNAYLPKE